MATKIIRYQCPYCKNTKDTDFDICNACGTDTSTGIWSVKKWDTRMWVVPKWERESEWKKE